MTFTITIAQGGFSVAIFSFRIIFFVVLNLFFSHNAYIAPFGYIHKTFQKSKAIVPFFLDHHLV